MDQTNYDVGPRVKIIMASRIKNIPDQFFPKQDFNMLSLLYTFSYSIDLPIQIFFIWHGSICFYIVVS